MSKLVPKLRFKEFSGEWEEKRLNNICDINPKIDNLPNNFIYIDLESVVAGKLIQENEIKKENAPSRAQRVLKNGDVIYQMVRPYQKNNLIFNFKNNKDYVASTGYAQLRAFNSNSFLYQLIHTNAFVNKVLENSTGTNYPAINSKELSKIKVIIPKSPQEQQKIADTLSSLDKLIEANSKRVEALKEHKKGLMQQLFPQEGEKMPKLRFKEFSGEWEEKSINDLFFYTNGGSFESKIIDDGQYNLITLNSIDINGELKSTHKTINNANTFLNKNDLVMVLSDVAHGNFLGLTAIIPNNNQYVLNQRMGGLRLKKENNIQFIRYFINLNQKYFKTHGHGSSQQNLSKSDILKFIVKIPESQKEQQKIADTLSSLDNLIKAQTKKVEALKEHKIGLMQQMFVSEELEDE